MNRLPSVPPTCSALLIGGALFVSGSSCGPAHIGPHTPRARHYEPGAYETASSPAAEGSLWQNTSRGLFADSRASQVGDIVTLRIDETPNATGDANTEMQRASSTTLGMPSMLGFTVALQQAYPDLNPEELINLMSESSFSGDGATSRSTRVRAAIAVRVKQRLPNGDLFVEGTKVLMVNDEELHIYISGVIRAEDIAPDNSVRSSLVADAQVEFAGRGVLTENQEQGWLARLIAAVNPF